MTENNVTLVLRARLLFDGLAETPIIQGLVAIAGDKIIYSGGAANAPDFPGAQLLDLGEATLASAMFNQADLLEQSGSLDPEAAKQLRYETRRLTRH
jgi:hypothetical protein